MQIRPISLSLFTTFFVAIFLLLLFSLGHLTYLELEKLNNRFHDTNQQLGEQEISTALSESLNIISQKTLQLAAWEEVIQQLQQPTYYTYWYRHRAKQNRFTSDYILDLSLYDAQGNVLASIDTSLLPDRIEPNQLGDRIEISEYQPFVTVVKPVVHQHSKKVLGYISTLNRLMPIIESHHFSTADPTTFNIAIEQSDNLSSEEFKQHLHYRLISDPYSQAIQAELTDFLFRLAGITAILTLLIFPLAAWLVSRPIMAITQHIDELKQYPYKRFDTAEDAPLLISELDTIRHSLDSYHNQLNQVNTTLDERNQQLQHLTQRDNLTGVLNRSAFDDYWKEISQVSGDNKLQTCLILFDINHFKALNDTYGHQAGDDVLITIAQVINNMLRGREQLFRLGGDEFATVLIGDNHRKAMQLAKQCHLAISNYPFEKLGILEPVRMSIGLAQSSSSDDSNLSALLWQADVAVHFAKRPGYSNIVSFSAELAQHAQGLFSNRTQSVVFDAIDNGSGLVLFYQPIVNLQTGQAEYYEALVRIYHEDQLIMPSHIFPLVEARSLELDLDRQVIRKICADLEAEKIPAGSGVSINLSAPTIVDSDLTNWLETLIPYMSEYKLLIEVTETALITQLETARKNLIKLRSMGFRVALDDFGSGYSSIRYLGTMPVDVVKFDITLTKLLEKSESNPILDHLAQMINESGHLLVAEGIESRSAAIQLRQLGFRYGQGYYFGKPKEQIPEKEDHRNPLNFSA
ncbi:MAG: bifunctional diguanylate cyclase/phosphodiesterase [Chromatiales bacterium]|nr:bifunctional diguanylate cyclase/phosphodiesterase [Chromatiales bacterium]